MKHLPYRGRSYKLSYIYSTLDLRDSPNLSFYDGNNRGVIQNAHLTEEELLTVPGLADTEWTYVRETHEWIPLFVLSSSLSKLKECVDIVPWVEYPNDLWVTPKGHPREQ